MAGAKLTLLNQNGWLYVAMDLKCDDRWKVGMTSQSDVYSRIKATANPDYFLVRAYAIPEGCNVREVEKYIHWRLEGRCDKRLTHKRTNQKSEWFQCDFINLISNLEYYLRNILSGLLGLIGKDNEYNLIEGVDETGKPFEELIYDEKIWVMNKFGIPLSQYKSNPFIKNYLDHVNSKLVMPFYTMADICSMQLNQSESASIKAFAQVKFDTWKKYQNEIFSEQQLNEIFNIYLKEEEDFRIKYSL